MSGRGKELVNEICTYSREGRIPKYGPLLFALAFCARSNDIQTKNAAYRSLAQVCTIPTHLFQFVYFAEALSGETSGWGRAQRKAISKWYNQTEFQKNPLKLLRLGSKYRRRHKFSHKDVLRLGHVAPETNHIAFVIKYFAKGKNGIQGFDASDGVIKKAQQFVLALEYAKQCTDGDLNRLCDLMKRHEFTHEYISTRHLNSPQVWQTQLYIMPVKALIRHLGKISSMGLLTSGSLEEQHVISRLRDTERLRRAKIHPFTLLTAWNSYKRGHSGFQRGFEWFVNQEIVDALETAFYQSNSFVQATGRRILVAVDGSEAMMHQPTNGMPDISARSLAVSTAFVMYKIQTNINVVLVTDHLVPIIFEEGENLESASQKFSLNGTSLYCDLAMPINWAIENNKSFDAIVLLTTSTPHIFTGATQNPVDVMRLFRTQQGVPHARLVVVSMSGNKFTVADPNDLDMLTVIGLDSKAVTLIFNFISGL